VEPLTRGLAGYFKRRMLKLPGVLWRLSRSPGVYARTLADYDVLLTPVVGHTTPKLGHLSPEVDFETLLPRLRNFVAFSPLNNATGSPAMSVPLGMTDSGLPIGVHFAGRHGDERTLLELACELEQARPFRRIQDATPPVDEG
jgi:amidase